MPGARWPASKSYTKIGLPKTNNNILFIAKYVVNEEIIMWYVRSYYKT